MDAIFAIQFANHFGNHLQRLLLAACCCSWLGLTGVKAKPLVSFGLGIQSHRTYQSPYAESYYGNEGGYHPYHPGNLYSEYPAYPAGYPAYPAYPYYHPATPYAPGNRYGALDIGIGALSLTPFLL